MDYLPIAFDLRGRTCLVVGGGEVAARKVDLLRRAGAALRIVAPRTCAQLAALEHAAGVELLRREYTTDDLDGVALVVAATDRPEVNARVAADARAQRVPVNVVDEPALCTFIMPAIIDRSPVLVAISTAGASPSLARMTRARVEAVLPQRLGQLARFAARHRKAVQSALPDVEARRRFWDDALSGAMAEHVLAGREAEADAELARALTLSEARTAAVTLIGVGAGEPDDLPLRAVHALSRADLVLHDARVPRSVLDLGRRDAAQASMGEHGGASGWSPAQVVEEAAAAAAAGRQVCVLWMGDPLAGSPEELALFAAQGIPLLCLRPAPPPRISL